MFYVDSDIELLKKKSDVIRAELEIIKNNTVEPTLVEQKEIQKTILNYCKEKKRKIYGGFAWNLLISNKNKADRFYGSDKVSDIDIYSPEPLVDWFNICNILFKTKGFKYVLGEEIVTPKHIT